MNGFNIYLSNFGILLLISGLFLLTGRQFHKANKLTFREAFFSLFFGIILLSTAFAIVKTGGKTIMFGFLLLALFYFFEKRKNPIPAIQTPQNTNRFVLIGLLFGAIFVFTWSFLTLGQFDDFPYHIPNGVGMAENDYLINVFRSYYLGLTGEENYYHIFNTLDEAYHGPKPYHYLEMWTTAALTSIFGGLTAAHFVLVTTPLYHLAAFLGIMALWEKHQVIKWYHLVLGASFLFLAGLHFSFYNDFKVLNFSLPIFTHRVKMVVYYPFMFAFLLQFDKKKWEQSILLLIGLMIATVVVAPALLGGVFIFLAYQFFIRKNRNTALKTAGYVISITAFIFLFYKFTETGQFNIRTNAGANSLVPNLLTMLTDAPIHKITTLLTLLGKEAILYLPLLGLVFILFLANKKVFANNLTLMVLVTGIVISGAGAYTLFEGDKDATQLFYNSSNALLNCLLIWVVIRLLSKPLKNATSARVSLKYFGIGCLLLLIFSKQIPFAVKRNIYPARTIKAYSDEYLQQIKTYILADNKTSIGAAIKGGKDYNSAFSKQTAAYTLGYYLAFMENGAVALNISDFDIPKLNWGDKLDRASNLFYRFVEEQKKAETFVSIGLSQVAFIEKYDLDFVVISKNGTLRKEVEDRVEKTIIDKISGERFLVLRK